MKIMWKLEMHNFAGGNGQLFPKKERKYPSLVRPLDPGLQTSRFRLHFHRLFTVQLRPELPVCLCCSGLPHKVVVRIEITNNCEKFRTVLEEEKSRFGRC